MIQGDSPERRFWPPNRKYSVKNLITIAKCGFRVPDSELESTTERYSAGLSIFDSLRNRQPRSMPTPAADDSSRCADSAKRRLLQNTLWHCSFQCRFQPVEDSGGNIDSRNGLQAFPAGDGIDFDQQGLIVFIVHDVHTGKEAAGDFCGFPGELQFGVSHRVQAGSALLRDVGSEVTELRRFQDGLWDSLGGGHALGGLLPRDPRDHADLLSLSCFRACVHDDDSTVLEAFRAMESSVEYTALRKTLSKFDEQHRITAQTDSQRS
jgi:hypothetical protein